jgi:hypothetical protein
MKITLRAPRAAPIHSLANERRGHRFQVVQAIAVLRVKAASKTKVIQGWKVRSLDKTIVFSFIYVPGRD